MSSKIRVYSPNGKIPRRCPICNESLVGLTNLKSYRPPINSDLIPDECPLCHGSLKDIKLLRTCKDCGKAEKILIHGRCTECHGKNYAMHHQNYRDRLVRKTETDFEEWLSKVKQVPADYPTITNEQWLEACSYFDGCAICSSDSMDARGMFIPFKVGGRYCDWNVVPVCEKCATAVRHFKNPFKAMHPRLGQRRGSIESQLEHYHNSGARLEKIVNYLLPRLEAAIDDN